VRAPGAEARLGGDHPVAFSQARRRGRRRCHLEDAFVSGYRGGFGRADERAKSRLCAVGALDRVDVGGVDGCGEGAQENGGGG
jgi:hypothetical protein